jgi:LDH2 family malate/lactate/ureidoglycolate dehydrogenase
MTPPADTAVVVDPGALRSFVTALLERVGFESREAAIAAEVFVRTDVRGVHTHGVYYLARYAPLWAAGGIRPRARPSIVRETPGTAVLDGDGGLGQLVAWRACEIAAAKARAVGSATVLVRNSNHFGAAGSFALKLAEEGLIGIVASNAPPLLTPPGGAGKAVSNAPTAYGFPDPDGNGPIVLDIAMSVGAGTKVLQAKARGEPIPEGWLLDANGGPSTDPDDLVVGGMAPIGGHKGYGLSLLVEMLAGVLSGAGVTRGVFSYTKVFDTPSGTGHWVQALDPAAFMDVAEFEQRLAALRDEIHGLRTVPGIERVLMPGDLEVAHEAQTLADGLELDPEVWRSVEQVAGDLDLLDELRAMVGDAQPRSA